MTYAPHEQRFLKRIAAKYPPDHVQPVMTLRSALIFIVFTTALLATARYLPDWWLALPLPLAAAFAYFIQYKRFNRFKLLLLAKAGASLARDPAPTDCDHERRPSQSP
ncbi:MAG: hypothetical protein ACYTF0_09585 [Planctomycetota bacterium]